MTCEYPVLDAWAPEDATPELVAIATELAWTNAIDLTNGRVALCPITVRPVCEGCARAGWLRRITRTDYALPYDTLLLHGDIACGAGHRRVLLEGPVGGIVEIRVDGAAVDPALWRLDPGRELIRQDGKFWPLHQDVTLPRNAVGSFEIDYFKGYRVGRLLLWAVSQLALEFFKWISGDKKCRLPANVQAVSRQGVSFDLSTPVFENGRTGIRELDLVFQRYNPAGGGPTVIASPDTIRGNPRRIS